MRIHTTTCLLIGAILLAAAPAGAQLETITDDTTSTVDDTTDSTTSTVDDTTEETTSTVEEASEEIAPSGGDTTSDDGSSEEETSDPTLSTSTDDGSDTNESTGGDSKLTTKQDTSEEDDGSSDDGSKLSPELAAMFGDDSTTSGSTRGGWGPADGLTAHGAARDSTATYGSDGALVSGGQAGVDPAAKNASGEAEPQVQFVEAPGVSLLVGLAGVCGAIFLVRRLR